MKNVYTHQIDLKLVHIPNTERRAFAQSIIELEYRGYEVEQIIDGRKIVITKPGGKHTYGCLKKEDIMVFIYDPLKSTLWQISHKQIFDDILKKCEESKKSGKILLTLLRRVFEGEEPDVFISEILSLNFETGENPEVLLKAYKWIWGQEDVNYPPENKNHQGRHMSWGKYQKLLDEL